MSTNDSSKSRLVFSMLKQLFMKRSNLGKCKSFALCRFSSTYQNLSVHVETESFPGSRIMYLESIQNNHILAVESKLQYFSENPIISAVFLSSKAEFDKSNFYPESKSSILKLNKFAKLILSYSRKYSKPLVSVFKGIKEFYFKLIH